MIKKIYRKLKSLKRILFDSPPPKQLHNVFKTNFEKKALLSYIPDAFNSKKLNKKHTNIYTSLILGEILHELGYTVDVVSWLYPLKGNYQDYDIILGLGASIDEAFKVKNNSTCIIFFATGCNPFYCNQVTVQRVIDFYNRNGKFLIDSSRFVYNDWPFQHEAADWIIVHGEEFAKKTYRNYNISKIKGPVFFNESSQHKSYQWENKRKNYIWFGSAGAIHKGLDLVLDAFLKLMDEDIYLHVCGNIIYENDFYEYYKPFLESKNIIYHGYVDIDSELFNTLMNNCGFVVFPSVSEGNSPSVITCMANGGMIPIVTEGADVEITKYGIRINDFSVVAVIDAIRQSQKLQLYDIVNQSEQIIIDTHLNHSFVKFKTEFKKQLKNIIK